MALETDVYLAHLALCDFRNYARLELDLQRQGALFKGPNGSGKTNILEAIHLVCVGRSQRGALRRNMIRSGATAGSVRAVFCTNDGRSIEAVFGFDHDGALTMRRDGRPVATLREWFGVCAAVSFGPEDLRLLTGGPVERRRYLDILSSQLDPAYLGHLIAYNRALTSRMKVLAGAQDGRLLDEYERQMVDHGAALHEKRREIATVCQETYARLYGEISGGTERASLRFASGIGATECGKEEWADVFSNTLKNNRKRDAEAGHSTRGCHRDNIVLLLDSRPARTYASQGQLRSMALALRLCAARCLAAHRRDSMLLLVDDAFSELDDQRIARVYPRLRECGQVFMATPVDRTPVERAMPQYWVCNGTVSAL